ncbi:MAG TPA: NfeD family protein [Planctomycetota bacterium]|nr:NfeD family protein [Planctomycetota bacterium]
MPERWWYGRPRKNGALSTDIMDSSFWSISLCFFTVLALFLEMLTPSFGLLTILALMLSSASVYLGFRAGSSFGYTMLAVNVALYPFSLWLGLKFLKWSPFVHRAELQGGIQNSPDAPPLTELVGKEGVTLTTLRPGGAAMIGQQRVDVVTQGKFVDPNTPVRVIQVEGSRVVVEPI